MIALNIVNGLNDREIALVERVEYKRLRIQGYAPPLPVAPALGREVPEYGVRGVHHHTQRARGYRFPVILAYGLEHCIVPVIRGEEPAYTLLLYA